jgi:pyruvate-ferredoxin/flavodoxin oxidoreductase
MKRVMDGNEAAAYAAYAFTEISAIYPITPSSPMAEKTDVWAAKGKKNIWGQEVTLIEMQSEAGAIGTIHGSLEAGAYATSYTSSQGLLLMIPVMHRIAGSRLPAVLHVASRTVGTHAMSIFGDHSDVMNCRQTGFALLSSASVQETMDLAAVTHLAAIKSRMPFLHFFDGFRTSHEIQKIDILDYSELEKLIDHEAVISFKGNALNPDHPTLRNSVQNPDIYFQVREANNKYYEDLPQTVEICMQQINELTGRDYRLVNYYGDVNAEYVIVAMGSVSGTVQETVDDLIDSGEKVGFVQIHLYRPFPINHFLEAIPKTTKIISVLDRTKEMGAVGEPLYQDICSLYTGRVNAPVILGGRYGLSSKDTTPAQIKAVFANMQSERPSRHFTIGIIDDVTHLSLPDINSSSQNNKNAICCKFWGLGSDGTVGANKNSIKIIGENTDLHVQAYFEYDTKKSFGITKSHLRFGKDPIRSSYLVRNADFIACHNYSYIEKYDIVSELKRGGVFLLNCGYEEERLEENLPDSVKQILYEKKAKFYIIDANRVSRELGLGDRSNAVLQAAFFKLSSVIPIDEAVRYMKKAIRETYQKKGEAVVNMNLEAVDKGISCMKKIDIPESWSRIANKDQEETDVSAPAFIKDILMPINAQMGDALTVSTFINCSDGTMPLGTTAYEKRGIATILPIWKQEQCVQCNRCTLVCPHAVIRSYLLDDREKDEAPEGFKMITAIGVKDQQYQFSLQFSDMDCTGCGICASVCPAKEKAIVMIPSREKEYQKSHWDFGLSVSEKGAFDKHTVKGSQFHTPLCEFSGACAGCGETPYAKLLTQLFGDRMYWANATGCTQAWGAAMPSFPYTSNKQGRGPAWSNSLFEDNAEFALGMFLADRQQRNHVRNLIQILQKQIAVTALEIDRAVVDEVIGTWLATYEDIDSSLPASEKLEVLLRALCDANEESIARISTMLLGKKNHFAKKTVWMFGGDGWAYDIGYGGLDHVVAMGKDVNAFIVDTEVYSNTGGQSSKATPMGAVAQFQSAGKRTAKKDLGKQMMAYGNVYVASVSMGADSAQLIKAIVEAESYPGPSVIIAYTPCIAHGIKSGMSAAQQEMKNAVESGYWPLYRYDPRKEKPFQLDFKCETKAYEDFLRGEIRYSSLERTFPGDAKKMFSIAAANAAKNLKSYRNMEEF